MRAMSQCYTTVVIGSGEQCVHKILQAESLAFEFSSLALVVKSIVELFYR